MVPAFADPTRAKVGTPQFPYNAHRYPCATRYGSKCMLVARERGPDSRAPAPRESGPHHPIKALTNTPKNLIDSALRPWDRLGRPLVVRWSLAFTDGCCHERVPKEG